MKLDIDAGGQCDHMSLPPRERGLKPVKGTALIGALPVAPPAGAWIETFYVANISNRSYVAPPAGAWIETDADDLCPNTPEVAPPAGAWIETGNTAQPQTQATSLPPRERGLKQFII